MDGRPNRRNKASFSLRISVDGRPNCRNKAVFFKFLQHSVRRRDLNHGLVMFVVKMLSSEIIVLFLFCFSKPTGLLRGHTAPIFHLFICPEDDRIFSVSTDKTVKVCRKKTTDSVECLCLIVP